MSPILNQVSESIEVANKLTKFIGSVLGESISDLAGAVQDKLSLFRWERQNRLIDRYNEVMRERGGGHRCAVPPKYAFPIVEAAAMEEDDDMQDCWARLLASASLSNSQMHSSLIGILREMESDDAKLLNSIYNECMVMPEPRPLREWERPIPTRYLHHSEDAPGEAFFVTLDNLIRLRCIKSHVDTDKIPVAQDVDELDEDRLEDIIYTLDHQYKKISITPLGLKLVRACMDTPLNAKAG